jgi:hypothetical protein
MSSKRPVQLNFFQSSTLRLKTLPTLTKKSIHVRLIVIATRLQHPHRHEHDQVIPRISPTSIHTIFRLALASESLTLHTTCLRATALIYPSSSHLRTAYFVHTLTPAFALVDPLVYTPVYTHLHFQQLGLSRTGCGSRL